MCPGIGIAQNGWARTGTEAHSYFVHEELIDVSEMTIVCRGAVLKIKLTFNSGTIPFGTLNVSIAVRNQSSPQSEK